MGSSPRRIRFQAWKEFHQDYLLEFAGLDRTRRAQILFRGHAQSGWALMPTLDRHQRGGFQGDRERREHYEFLLAEFRREALRFVAPPLELPVGESFELSARHRGDPSPILDWSESPYVAAFFAYNQAVMATGRRAATWALECAALDEMKAHVRMINAVQLFSDLDGAARTAT